MAIGRVRKMEDGYYKMGAVQEAHLAWVKGVNS